MLKTVQAGAWGISPQFHRPVLLNIKVAESSDLNMSIPEKSEGVTPCEPSRLRPDGGGGIGQRYVMVFALSTDHEAVLLQHKPATHKNPLFRDRWTVPGGHVEAGESEIEAAVREFREETGICLLAGALRFVLRFACNCDPTESEHEVAVFGALLSMEILQNARGSEVEPVQTFVELPTNTQWYLRAMLELVASRMAQPFALQSIANQQGSRDGSQGVGA